MPHFRDRFGHPPAAVIFTQNLDNPQLRLARKNWAILETHGLSVIALKFWKDHGQSITIWEGPIWSPNRG